MSLRIVAADISELNVLSVVAGASGWIADKTVRFIAAGGGEQMCLFDRRSSNSRRTAGSRVHLHAAGEEWLAIKEQYNRYPGVGYEIKTPEGYSTGSFQVSGFEISTEVTTTGNKTWNISGLRPDSAWSSGYLIPGSPGAGPLVDSNFVFSTLVSRSGTSAAKYARLYIDGNLVLTVTANQYFAVGFIHIGKVNSSNFSVQVVCDSGITVGNYISIAGIRIVS